MTQCEKKKILKKNSEKKFQVLEHPWMTQCEKKPRVNEIEEEVQQYVAGKVDVCTFVLICTHVC